MRVVLLYVMSNSVLKKCYVTAIYLVCFSCIFFLEYYMLMIHVEAAWVKVETEKMSMYFVLRRERQQPHFSSV